LDELLNEIIFLFQRLDWLSILDLVLVTAVLFGVLMLLRDTQAMVLLRGVLLLVVALAILTSLVNLQAFSWLITNALPALLLAVPVIFAPEIRRGLERLGRAGPNPLAFPARRSNDELVRQMIRTTVTTCARLSARQHGALIVLQREDNLREYMQTGILLNARASTELLLQIFYPNTPLHDGAAILVDDKVIAASCVMPLSASGVLNRAADRRMGLRHRAALGISEVSDAIAVVVSEETGSVSVAQGGRMIRRLDSERLENILLAFFQADRAGMVQPTLFFQRWFEHRLPRKPED